MKLNRMTISLLILIVSNLTILNSHLILSNTSLIHPLLSTKPAGSGKGAVKSPLPGIIIDVKVGVGDQVNKGDTVAVLEAMKMENVIPAPVAGTVTSISVNPGDSILEGVVILTIE